MSLAAFGYVGLRSDKLDDWAEYAPKFLGLQLVERTQSALKFRMDDRKQRIVESSDAAIQNVVRLGRSPSSGSLRGPHSCAAFTPASHSPIRRVRGLRPSTALKPRR